MQEYIAEEVCRLPETRVLQRDLKLDCFRSDQKSFEKLLTKALPRSNAQQKLKYSSQKLAVVIQRR